MTENITAGNAVLRIVSQSRELYITFTDIYEKVGWFANKAELFGELERLVRCGYIRMKGINSELHIRITGAGIAFMVKSATDTFKTNLKGNMAFLNGIPEGG